jgi:hypothetical protein
LAYEVAKSASHAFSLGTITSAEIKSRTMNKFDIKPFYVGMTIVNGDIIHRGKDCVY